jgi:lipopolysaccharide/colanic/teichoic acid biosynthesis glycosyltransferase
MIKLTYEKFILFLLIFVTIEVLLLLILQIEMSFLIFIYFVFQALLFVSIALHKNRKLLSFMVIVLFNSIFIWLSGMDVLLIVIPVAMLFITTMINDYIDNRFLENYIIVGESPLLDKIKDDLRSFHKNFDVVDSVDDIKKFNTNKTIVIYSEKEIEVLLHSPDFQLRELISDIEFYEKYLLKIPLLYYKDEAVEFKAINQIKSELKNNFLLLIFIRIFDIIAAGLLFLFFSPFIIVIALLIKFVDKQEDILFRQIRYGKHKKKFAIYKFKTMVEATNEAKITTENDSRVTTLGKWIRKYHLDELPQIYNIFKGDISLVGPRPINYKLEDELSEKIKYYDLKYLVKPGITGDSQILSMDTRNFNGQIMRTEYDWYLIKYHNVTNIFYILVKTVQAFFTGHGSR